MAKDIFYFKHDANASSDLKLKALRKTYGWAGIGWWWFMVEILRSEDSYQLEYSDSTFDGLAIDMGCEPDKVKEFVNYCIERKILEKTDGTFYSPRMKRDMDALDALREVRREAGRSSAKKKENISKCSTSVKQKPTKCSTIRKEDKEDKEDKKDKKDNKDKSIYGEFKNVQLTDQELQKLNDNLGKSNTLSLIEKLSTYKKSTGKKYKDDYATLLNWSRRDAEKTPKGNHPKPTASEVEVIE